MVYLSSSPESQHYGRVDGTHNFILHMHNLRTKKKERWLACSLHACLHVASFNILQFTFRMQEKFQTQEPTSHQACTHTHTHILQGKQDRVCVTAICKSNWGSRKRFSSCKMVQKQFKIPNDFANCSILYAYEHANTCKNDGKLSMSLKTRRKCTQGQRSSS
jgi:hypothetical protein